MRFVLMLAGVLGAGALAACGSKGGGADDNPSSCPIDASEAGPTCPEVDLACSYRSEMCVCMWPGGPCNLSVDTFTCAADHAWSYATELADCSCPASPPTPGTPCTPPSSSAALVQSCGYDEGCGVSYVYACDDGAWVDVTGSGPTSLPCPPPPPPL